MPPAGFEPTIPPSERPQTHALDSAVIGTGLLKFSTGITIFLNAAVKVTWEFVSPFGIPFVADFPGKPSF